MAITTSCFVGRFGSSRGSGSGSLSIADHSCSISAARSPTLRLFSTPGSAFHNARSRLPLSGAASSSSFDETTISPSLTAAGASRHIAMLSLPMMQVRMGGFSWLARRPAAAGDPTHALFAAQSHSIVDNLVPLFEHSRAWNCSNQERALATASTALGGTNGGANEHQQNSRATYQARQ